jgi:hypothetical protein
MGLGKRKKRRETASERRKETTVLDARYLLPQPLKSAPATAIGGQADEKTLSHLANRVFRDATDTLRHPSLRQPAKRTPQLHGELARKANAGVLPPQLANRDRTLGADRAINPADRHSASSR